MSHALSRAIAPRPTKNAQHRAGFVPRHRRRLHPFVASVMALALVFASLAPRPAAAASELEKFLFGAATLLIIGTAIENERRREHSAHRVTPSAPKNVAPKAAPKKKARAARLPEYCLRTVRSPKGPRLIYDRRCLRDNYRQYSDLPRECRTVISSPNGERRGYRTGCLYRAGFTG